jgi:putative redox protein
MAVDIVKIKWQNTFNGELEATNGKVLLGREANTLQPYDLLFGALGACYYSTFLTIVEKKRLQFDGATLEISGNKRLEVPTTLEYVLMKLVIKNPSNIDQFQKCIELAAKHCSVHETISKVAKIDIEVKYE